MTKRKRDIFTIIESINKWFEASESNTNTLEDPEDKTNLLIANNGSSDSLTVNGLSVESSRPAEILIPGAEASHVSPHPNCTSIRPGPRSEVADPLISVSEAPYPPAAEVGHVAATGDSHERGQPAGYSPGIGETTGPDPGPEEEGELTTTAFWKLLADAGYDVW